MADAAPAQACSPAVNLVGVENLSKNINIAGLEVTVGQWRRWVREDSIPHLKVGQKVFFNPDAVRNWLCEKARTAPPKKPKPEKKDEQPAQSA